MQKILIVDDSALFRKCIETALIGQPNLEITGTAANGRLALEKLQRDSIDVAVVDVEMPEMGGLELLEEIGRLGLKVQVILFAAATKSSALASLKGLNRGAFDFVLKPVSEEGADPAESIRSLLIPKIQAAALAKASHSPMPLTKSWHKPVNINFFHAEALVVGSSTGGPAALEQIFSEFDHILKVPLFIVQHMPPIFTAALAERLQKLSGISIKEAAHGDVVQIGHGYVAPGDYHMRVVRDGDQVVIELNRNEKRHSVRPAVDELFQSAADVYGKRLLGAVLTGMGDDGRDGARSIKDRGGAVIVQEAKSCVVYGMPKAVVESGAFDESGDLEKIRRWFQAVCGERMKRSS